MNKFLEKNKEVSPETNTNRSEKHITYLSITENLPFIKLLMEKKNLFTVTYIFYT